MSDETPLPTSVPDDFPRGGPITSIAGAQPKMAARLVDGQYIVGWTSEELLERYESCEDLARQLAAYCTRKAIANPGWSKEFNLERAARGLSEKVGAALWDVTVPEQLWVMGRVKLILGW